nr:hypothetical protein [Neobacillus sp. 179.-C4.2 HS]
MKKLADIYMFGGQRLHQAAHSFGYKIGKNNLRKGYFNRCFSMITFNVF